MKNTWDAGSGSSSADGATPVGEFLGCHHQFMGYTVNGNIHGIYIYISSTIRWMNLSNS
jgi:hypothetical protein